MLFVPATVKWIRGLIIAQYIIFAAIILLSIYYIAATPTGPSWTAVGRFVAGLGVDAKEGAAYNSGAVIGRYLVPILVLGFMMKGLNSRKKRTFFIALTLSALFAIGLRAFPLFQIVILVLALQQSSKDYFASKRTVEFDSI